jgi:hypothetical protein
VDTLKSILSETLKLREQVVDSNDMMEKWDIAGLKTVAA